MIEIKEGDFVVWHYPSYKNTLYVRGPVLRVAAKTFEEGQTWKRKPHRRTRETVVAVARSQEAAQQIADALDAANERANNALKPHREALEKMVALVNKHREAEHDVILAAAQGAYEATAEPDPDIMREDRDERASLEKERVE